MTREQAQKLANAYRDPSEGIHIQARESGLENNGERIFTFEIVLNFQFGGRTYTSVRTSDTWEAGRSLDTVTRRHKKQNVLTHV